AAGGSPLGDAGLVLVARPAFAEGGLEPVRHGRRPVWAPDPGEPRPWAARHDRAWRDRRAVRAGRRWRAGNAGGGTSWGSRSPAIDGRACHRLGRALYVGGRQPESGGDAPRIGGPRASGLPLAAGQRPRRLASVHASSATGPPDLPTLRRGAAHSRWGGGADRDRLVGLSARAPAPHPGGGGRR